MKPAPPPIHNSLQAYFRLLFRQEYAVGLQRRTICPSCVQGSQRIGKRYSSTSALDKTGSYVRPITNSTRRCPSRQHVRQLANVVEREDYGPLKEYDDRVHSRKLREDEHQRSQCSHSICSNKTNHVQPSLRTCRTFTRRFRSTIHPQ